MTTNWDELEHSDDWPDRTTREPELEPDEEGKKYLAQLEKELHAVFDAIEKQQESLRNGTDVRD